MSTLVLALMYIATLGLIGLVCFVASSVALIRISRTEDAMRDLKDKYEVLMEPDKYKAQMIELDDDEQEELERSMTSNGQLMDKVKSLLPWSSKKKNQ